MKLVNRQPGSIENAFVGLNAAVAELCTMYQRFQNHLNKYCRYSGAART
jgi:hypothetical protein